MQPSTKSQVSKGKEKYKSPGRFEKIKGDQGDSLQSVHGDEVW
ncbi:MAG TPA: hypothetical protein PLR06_06700 [Cyclobacteriaceae bacterium]|nr:hypothetical protein [Cyclobacteriaceae bacterium]